MSAIWNHLSPLRTGHVKLAPGSMELYGTVMRHGKMDKTVTVSNAKSLLILNLKKKLAKLKEFSPSFIHQRNQN